jgi:hypothetical protein
MKVVGRNLMLPLVLLCALARRARFMLALLLLCAPTLCAAQTKPHSMSGQVINSVTGEPIPRALVQFGAQHATLTDHEGRYEVDGLTENYDRPFASKPGYFPGDRLAVHTRLPGVIELIPEAILSGTVLDDQGHPVQGLHLELKVLQVRNGRITWQQAASAATNVEGEFRFADLQAGHYKLVSDYQLEGLPDAPSSVAFLPVTYPAAAADQASGSLALAPGSHVQADLNIAAEPIYPVTGMVKGPIPSGLAFEVETAAGEMVSGAWRVFPDGAFRLYLPSGSYRLRVRAFVQPTQLQGTREIEVSHGPLAGVAISLAAVAVLPVEVEYQAVETSPTQQLSGPTHSQPVYLALQNEDSRIAEEYPATPIQSRTQHPDAPLVIPSVLPGRYHLWAQPNAPWYLASASCGDLDLMRNPLVIAESSGTCTIRAVMRNDSATLKWSVDHVASSPLNELSPSDQGSGPSSVEAQVFVAALPLDNLTQPEAAGTFGDVGAGPASGGEFPNLPPGHYLVVALTHQKDIAFRDPEVLKTYQSLGQEVTLERNGHADVQLHLEAPPVGEP